MGSNKRKAILFATLAMVTFFVVSNSNRGTEKSRAPSDGSSLERSDAIAAQLSSKVKAVAPPALTLPARPALGEPGGALFGSQSWQRPAPEAVAAKPVKPSAPPMPYRFAGRVLRDGKVQLFLAKEDVAIPISPGKILDGIYRVEAIGKDRVTIVYLPLNRKYSVALRYVVPAPTETQVANAEQDGEARLISDFGRWTQLSREKRREITEYLAQIPASAARERLIKEYKRQVWGIEE